MNENAGGIPSTSQGPGSPGTECTSHEVIATGYSTVSRLTYRTALSLGLSFTCGRSVT